MAMGTRNIWLGTSQVDPMSSSNLHSHDIIFMERAFREVKRRTRPVDVFGNRDCMERILCVAFFHLNSKGQDIPYLFFTQNS